MRNVIKCEVWLTSKNSQPSTEHPSLTKVGIARQSPIHEIRGVIELMGYMGESISTHTQRYGIVCSQMHCFPGQPRRFRALFRALDHPAIRHAPHVAPRGHAIGRG